MQELKTIIAANIQLLRKEHKMTQNELAQKINYTDKAVSKWERAESVPDISALKQIADTFSVTLDYLITVEHTEYKKEKKEIRKTKKKNRKIISLISVVTVWLVALFIYMNIDLFAKNNMNWLVFIYAVPTSLIVALIFNSIWGNTRYNYLIISFIMWTVLSVVFITLLLFDYNVWTLLLLGIPAQIIIILWSFLKTRAKKPTY
ncbi:MAG: helix-turn-helix domain-containing protein [Ruminococcaceae bacterium]|nr:helix-turn-helix domain-containing protein [Oscillospiraceae bacterium]